MSASREIVAFVCAKYMNYFDISCYVFRKGTYRGRIANLETFTKLAAKSSSIVNIFAMKYFTTL